MEISDYGVPRLTDVELNKQVELVTSVWAKSAQEGNHVAITLPFEVLHHLRGFWIKEYKENNETT